MSGKKSSKNNSQKGNIFNSYKNVVPLTIAQNEAFKHWDNDYNLILDGSAGAGKTFISMALAFKAVLDRKTPHKKVIIIRSAVPSRDMGFMPGTLKEKTDMYTRPYRKIISELFDSSAWDYLEQNGLLEFESTSFIRGITLDNAIVIADEMQNMNFEELNTVMTRIGQNSRMIFSGDYYQSDLHRDKEKSGILKFLEILDNMKDFARVNFTHKDIVRSDIVKDYIITKENLKITG